MAIAFDSVGTGNETTTGGSIISWTHTVSSNTNGAIFALMANRSTGTITASPKFAGQNMTFVNRGTSTNAMELWYLLNPPTGLGTFNGTFDTTSNARTAVSMAYTGVLQASPINGSTSGTAGAVASGSVVDTTMATNAWFIGGESLKVLPGTTSTGNERGTANATNLETMGADNTGGTLRWTFGTLTQAWVGLAAEVLPYGTIILDNTGTAGTTASATTISWTHTVNSNSNGVIFAQLGAGGTTNVTNIAFAGQNMTQIIAGTSSITASQSIWYLLNPPTGLGTFNGTWSANSTVRSATSVSLTGVDQTNPILGSINGSFVSTTSGSISLTTTNDTNWLLGGISANVTLGTSDATTGQLERAFGGVSGQETRTATNGPVSPAASKTLRYTFATGIGVIQAVEVNATQAVVAAAANQVFMALLGAGNI